jgi:hypothetical protein
MKSACLLGPEQSFLIPLSQPGRDEMTSLGLKKIERSARLFSSAMLVRQQSAASHYGVFMERNQPSIEVIDFFEIAEVNATDSTMGIQGGTNLEGAHWVWMEGMD